MSQTSLRVYRDLAAWYDRARDYPMRDRFLVLAASEALSGGLTEEAERIRLRLLQANPHHLLKPYASIQQALVAPDVKLYVNDLRVNYPLPVAQQLLAALQAGQVPPPNSEFAPASSPDVDLGNELGLAPTVQTGLRMFAGPESEQEEDVAMTAPLPPQFAAPPTLPPRPATPPRPEPPPPKMSLPRPSPAPPAPAPALPPPAQPRPSSWVPPTPQPVPGPPANGSPAAVSPAAQTQTPAAPGESPASVWVSLVLFLVVVGGGLALAAYVLVRPLLP